MFDVSAADKRSEVPDSLVFVGGYQALTNLIEFGRKPIDFLEKNAQKYGDSVCFSLAGIRLYIFNHPNQIEEILCRQNQHLTKDASYRALKGLVGNGLLLSEGDLWKRHRRMMQSAFNNARIADYGKITTAQTARMLRDWQMGEVKDIHREMSLLTVKIIAQALFGVDVDETAVQIGEALDEYMLHYFCRAERWFLVPEWFPTVGNWRAKRAVRQLEQVVDDIIRQRQREPKDDLLSQMLATKDEDEQPLTLRTLRDEIMTLLVAGHETTADALTWALMLLSQNPSVADKLYAEVSTVLAGRLPTLDDLPQLTYVENVVKESMRLYPPAWALGREVLQDCQIGQHSLKRGDTLYVSQWVVHRDSRFFEKPEQFLPERWENKLEQRLPRCAYFPFGAGPRVCIGKAFSMMEAPLILATIAQKFRLNLVKQQPVELLPSITLRPKHGLNMLLSR